MGNRRRRRKSRVLRSSNTASRQVGAPGSREPAPGPKTAPETVKDQSLATPSRSNAPLWVVGVFALTLFLMVNPDPVRVLIDPTEVVGNALWLVAVLVIGNGAVTLVAFSLRDLMGSNEGSLRLLSPKFLTDALSATGVATLWFLFVAVLCGGPRLGSDVLAYLGNATLIGVLLGLLFLAPKWLIGYVRAVIEVGRQGDFRSTLMLVIAVVIMGAVLVAPTYAAVESLR